MAKKRKERTAAEKSADFKRLANKHANTALGAIVRLGKLARPGRYSWTPDQIKKLEGRFAELLGQTFGALKSPQTATGKMTEDIL